MNSEIGKEAERKIKEWLNKPDQGFCFDRIPDQMTGMFGSKNICDFILFKSPEFYYIESKSTWNSNIPFNVLTETQYNGLLSKSKIDHVHGVVIILFASHKRAFMLDIQQIDCLVNSGKKSINIDKIDKWDFRYGEIKTISNNRKKLLDYCDDFESVWRQAEYEGYWNI